MDCVIQARAMKPTGARFKIPISGIKEMCQGKVKVNGVCTD